MTNQEVIEMLADWMNGAAWRIEKAVRLEIHKLQGVAVEIEFVA